ncbi:MAG: DUF4249 family protein [Bacteroidota bacterium]
MRLSFLALLAVALGSLASCDTYENDPYRDLVVVDAIMEALAPVPSVFLSTTVPLEATSDPRENGLDGATVTLERLSPDGTVADTIQYFSAFSSGQYVPNPFELPIPTVRPATRYRLRIDAPGFDPIWAETVVPDTFSTVVPPNSPLVYQGPEQPTVVVTPSAFPGRQTVYIFSVLAQSQSANNPNPDDLVPLFRSIYDTIEGESDRLEFLKEALFSSSPLLNEEGYSVNSDGTLTVPVPWAAFGYYGFNKLSASAVDDALLLFLSTQAAQFTPTTLSPGEIPNITTNVQGGLGVFGAYARSEAFIVIERDVGEP